MKTQVKIYLIITTLLSLALVSGSVSRFIPVYTYYANSTPSQVTAIYYLAPSAIDLQQLTLTNGQLRELAEKNDSNAAYQLALRLMQQGDHSAAKLWWLAHFAEFTLTQQRVLTEQLVNTKQWHEITSLWQAKLLPEGNAKQAWLLREKMPVTLIDLNYAKQQQFSLTTDTSQANEQCKYNVLMLTDHHKGIATLKQYKQQYQHKPEPAADTFCFSEVVYVANQYSCGDSSGLLKCNWQNASQKTWPMGFDFIVMVSKQGAANVQGGIMHINSSHSYAVFLHELMHLNGFEDEYALPLNKQQWLCSQQGQVAPNLFIANQVSPPKNWQMSIACDNKMAFKPSTNWSIMQYQTIGLSEQYRKLWQKQINHPLTKPIRFSEYFAFLSVKPVITSSSTEQIFSD